MSRTRAKNLQIPLHLPWKWLSFFSIFSQFFFIFSLFFPFFLSVFALFFSHFFLNFSSFFSQFFSVFFSSVFAQFFSLVFLLHLAFSCCKRAERMPRPPACGRIDLQWGQRSPPSIREAGLVSCRRCCCRLEYERIDPVVYQGIRRLKWIWWRRPLHYPRSFPLSTLQIHIYKIWVHIYRCVFFIVIQMWFEAMESLICYMKTRFNPERLCVL